MAIRDDYTDGTITLTAGSVDFTTVGSALVSADIRKGDQILLPAKGAFVLVEEITGENSGKLSDPCPAIAAGAGQNLRIRFLADGQRYSAAAQTLMLRLASGNLDALAELIGDFEKLPIFTGPGAMELIDKADLVTGVAFDVQVPTLAARAAYDASAKNFKVLVSDIGDGRAALYVKKSSALADWSVASPITGPVGPPVSVLVDPTTTLPPGTPAAVVNTGTPTAPKLAFGVPQGVQGYKGWSMKPAIIVDGATREVIQIVDWIGGEGTKPPVGQYVGATGLVTSIADAINIKGETGSQGASGTPYQGTWAIGISYLKNDVVKDNDAVGEPALWIALRDNIAKKPKDNALDWDPFPASFASVADYGSITDPAFEIRDYGSIA
jgi:hypothetical protein